MKNILFGLLICSLSNLNLPLQGQDSKLITTSVKVHGVCDECKVRIENAAYIKGVKHTKWNKETEELTIIYKPEKVTQELVEKSIAATGHDTENFSANDQAYNKLPNCCAYRNGVEKH